jgi:hypothetical protein
MIGPFPPLDGSQILAQTGLEAGMVRTNGGNPTVNSRCLWNYLVYDRSFPPLDGSQILEQIFSKIPRS